MEPFNFTSEQLTVLKDKDMKNFILIRALDNNYKLINFLRVIKEERDDKKQIKVIYYFDMMLPENCISFHRFGYMQNRKIENIGLCFHEYRTELLRTAGAFLKPSDRVYFQILISNNDQTIDECNLNRDELQLRVIRSKTNIITRHEYAFLLSSSVALNNSARPVNDPESNISRYQLDPDRWNVMSTEKY
jgi:hypothetical protein